MNSAYCLKTPSHSHPQQNRNMPGQLCPGIALFIIHPINSYRYPPVTAAEIGERLLYYHQHKKPPEELFRSTGGLFSCYVKLHIVP